MYWSCIPESIVEQSGKSEHSCLVSDLRERVSYISLSDVMLPVCVCFYFIFVNGERVCSNFIDLHAAVQVSQHHLLKRLTFSHCIFLPPLSKIN